MQREDEYRVQFHEEARDCCQFLLYKLRKKLGFIVVCTLLFIVLLSVIVALYYGISLKEFSSLAIGLGIWLPSVLLGMVCAYTAMNCMKKSTSHFTTDGSLILDPHYNRENQLNFQVKYQANINRESTEVPLQVKQGAVYTTHLRSENREDIVDDEFHRRRHFRSLSSSNLNSYKNKQNLNDRNREECAYSLERIDNHDRYTSENKLQREEGNHGAKFKRSLSETRNLKYKHKKSSQYASNYNQQFNAPEQFNERSYFRTDEQGKFYCRNAEDSPRVRQNSEKYLCRETAELLDYNSDNLHPSDYMEENGHFSNNLEQFHIDYPESTTRFDQYSVRNPYAPNFNSSSVTYNPRKYNPVFHSSLPTREMGYSRNSTKEVNYSPRVKNKERYIYESNNFPNSLQQNGKTFIPTDRDRTYPKEICADFQFSNSRINAFKPFQDFSVDGYSSNNNKVSRNVTPVTVTRSNFEVRPSVHQQSSKIAPYYNAKPPSMDCLLQRENNSEGLEHNMLKKRSPRERSKM